MVMPMAEPWADAAILGDRDLCESATYADLAPLPDGGPACLECRARDADPHAGHELAGIRSRLGLDGPPAA